MNENLLYIHLLLILLLYRKLEMSDRVNGTIIRQATVADYEAVMSIVEGVIGSDGVDYLPATYHDFLQDKQHASYVAETIDGHRVVRCSITLKY